MFNLYKMITSGMIWAYSECSLNFQSIGVHLDISAPTGQQKKFFFSDFCQLFLCVNKMVEQNVHQSIENIICF